jgi:hypothetical protein
MMTAGKDTRGSCFKIISDFPLMCLEEELRKTSVWTVFPTDSDYPRYVYKPEASPTDQGFSSKRLYFRQYKNLSLYVGKRLPSVLFILNTHS